MHLLELLKSAISCLMANKGRLILGISSISIGVSVLIGAMILFESQKVSLRKEIEKIGVNLIDVGPGQPSQRFSDRDVAMIKRCSGVLKVAAWSGVNMFSVQYFNKSLGKILVIGWMPEVKNMTNLSLKEGRFFTWQEVESRCNVGVIGKDVASKLFGETNPVGEYIFIIRHDGYKVRVRIVGVLNELGTLQSHMTLIRNDGIVLPLTYMRDKVLSGKWYRSVGTILLQTKDDVEEKEVMRQIEREFTIRNTSCRFFTLEEIIVYEEKLLRRTTLIGISIAAIFLIVGGIGIINIMLKSVMERTREIGIRKAVGAKKKDILIQFLIEALMIGILGCIAGILIGLVGVNFIPAGLIKGGTVIVSFQTIFISSGVAIGISLLFGIYPAYRASSLPPIDALRYE